MDPRAATYQVEPDFAARQAVLWSVAWLVGSAFVAAAVHLLLLFGDLVGGIELLSYGRLRGAADAALVFGWLGTAGFAAVYAILPRIAEAQLHNEVLGAATTLTWALVVTAGVGTLVFGLSQGRPLAEFPAGVDVALVILLVFVLFNAGVTVVRRREGTLYVSGWYLLAAAVLAPIVFVVGNLPVFTGVTDMIVSGFYQNGVEMLWFLPLALAVAHYVIPVETGNPLYSSALARAGFWSLMFAGGWTGQRFFMKGPGPDYLESIAFAMTVVLLVPVITSVVNLSATGRGRWHLLEQAYGLRWAAAGLGLLVAWIALTVVGTVPWVSRSVGLTSYHGALRHLAVWGVFTAFALALVYHAYPLMVGRDWYSRRLASFHFWATLGGVLLGVAAQLGASAVQVTTLGLTTPGTVGAMAQAAAQVQQLFTGLLAIAALVVATAQAAFGYNTYRTARSGPFVRVVAPTEVGSRA